MKGSGLGGFGSLKPSLNFATRKRKCQRPAVVPMVVFESKRTEQERCCFDALRPRIADATTAYATREPDDLRLPRRLSCVLRPAFVVRRVVPCFVPRFATAPFPSAEPDDA